MANVDIRLGHKNTAWFTTNSTLVLKDGQMVVCSDGANQGKYKIGDGINQLSALIFYGGVSVSPAWGSITGTLSNQTDLQNALNAKQNTITTGTTAQYFRGDLSLATFPTNVSTFTNDSGYLTGITSLQVTTALGFTPYNATNPSGFITSAALSGYQPLNTNLTGLSGLSYVSGTPFVKMTAAGTFSLDTNTYLTTTSAASTYQPIGSYLTGNQTITVSGDASGSGATSIALTLATVNSNVGTFNNVTVNAKGLVTAASNVSYLTGLTVGSTAIGSGTNTRILYNNGGVLGEYTVTGTGTTAVLSTSPTFTTGIQINAGTNSGRAFELFQDTASVKIGSRVGTTSDGAIYFNASTPSSSSNQIWGSTNAITINGSSGLNLQVGVANAIVINSFLEQTYTNFARTSGAFTAFTWTKANSTGQTASTNIPGFLFTTGSRQWATGAITTQEEIRITSPTYSFVGASTITNAYTLFVNSPTAGTNATITNNYAAGFGGAVQITGAVSAVGIINTGNASFSGFLNMNSQPIRFLAGTAASPGLYFESNTCGIFSSTANVLGFSTNGTSRVTISTTDLTISDAFNISFNTTTGSKIGTATTQKLAFWNATPIVQPSAVTTVQGFYDAMSSIGLIASGTITLPTGYTKSINNISTNTSAGAAANTEYYYICTASLTLTLPTAVGNTNEYNIKVTSGTLTINTTSSQTIDGSTSATISVANTAVTLISDGSNWQIF